jgi:hypothetical protein
VLIPILIIWKRFTATARGSAVKVVACENCSTEYVYVMKREGVGAGTSLYWLNEEGAASRAKAAAAEMLQALLDKDYDPVPCPVCGHYQRYMFPKLLGEDEIRAHAVGPGLSTLILVATLIGCLDAAMALYCSVAYLLDQNDHDFKNMVTAWSVLLPLALIGLGLLIVRRSKIRRFDPNLEDRQARIVIGRSRALTRAEFEEGQQPGDGPKAGESGHTHDPGDGGAGRGTPAQGTGAGKWGRKDVRKWGGVE